MDRNLRASKPSSLLRLILAGVALLIPTTARSQTFLPDGRAAERQLFPVTKSEFAVAAGDTIADRVLGQMDFVHATQNFADASTLDIQRSLGAVAIDRSSTPNRIYVADAGNNRVLGWTSVTALTNGKAADMVIGQPDFFSTTCNNGGVSASSLCEPEGIAIDSSGNLYVADAGNNRVLEYNTPFTNTGAPGSGDRIADEVFGQEENFTTKLCNQGAGITDTSDTLCRPRGIAIDLTGVLYIADSGNNRVLEYLFPSINTTPNDLFGQLGHFNLSQCNRGGALPDADSLCAPSGLATDAENNLYVTDTGNSRVLEYDNPPFNDTTADNVLGQGNVFVKGGCNDLGGAGATAQSLCDPQGVGLDTADHVYVSDSGNNRVLVYATPAVNTTANKVFGQNGSLTGSQCNFSGNIDAAGLCRQSGLALDGAGNLYVVDGVNNRVLKYNSAFSGDTTADAVLGQPDFAHGDPNLVDASGFGGSANEVVLAGTVNFTALGKVAIDNTLHRLYVADPTNNRVLGFNNASSFANGAAAAVVIGQQTFSTGTSKACNPGGATASNLCTPLGVAVDGLGNLYVADFRDNRVLKFAAPVVTGEPATLVIGQPNFSSQGCNSIPGTKSLCEPTGLALDAAGDLYVADTENNRVVEYTKGFSSTPTAAHVFGQPGLGTNACNQGGSVTASTLCFPNGVAVDSTGRLYIADSANSRVLFFKTPLANPSGTANMVFGQGATGTNFTSTSCNDPKINDLTLCNPTDVTIDGGGNLYVADSMNNRIVHYNTTFPGATEDVVFGQGGYFITSAPNLGGTAPNAATLSLPLWLATDTAGNLYATDAGNNRVLQYEAPAGGPSPTPTPGMATVSPSGLLFGNIATGNTSAIKTATLTNNGAGTIIVNAINKVGSNPNDFVQTNNCIGNLAGGKSCTIKVSFTPSLAPGQSEAVQFVIFGNSKNAPQLFEAYGNAALPATLAPTSVNFGNVAVANISLAKSFTLTNNRSVAMTISSIAFGGTNPADFSKTTTCGASLAAFASCTVSVKFTPAALGARSGTLVISDSASNSPQSAMLTGTGAAPATVTPSALAFGNVTKGTTSAAKVVTVTNNLSTALTLSSIGLGGTNPGDFLKATTCGASLAAFGSCTVSVSFKPTVMGARSATLAVTDSPDSGSPHNVALSGTGQ